MKLYPLMLATLLLFVFCSTKGQIMTEPLSLEVKNDIKELNKKGVDTFCIYQDYCVGCVYTWKTKEDKCWFTGLFISTYIVWLDKGETFMTKKDNCFDYSTIKISNDSIWKFFFKNHAAIVRDEIKIPQHIEVKNGKKEIYSSSIDHSRHQDIRVIVRQDTLIDKDLDDYYFSKMIGFGEDKNINYEHNINTSLKEFQLVVARTIKSEAGKRKLQKTRR
jgi:hypothetical protein